MNKQKIRQEFENAVGRDHYLKFLRGLPSCKFKRRLAYWQQQLWLKFCAVSDCRISEDDFETIYGLFQYCHLHNEELQLDSVPIVYGTRSPLSEEKVLEMANNCPYANLFFYGDCCVEEATEAEVMFCPDCRNLYHKLHRA